MNCLNCGNQLLGGFQANAEKFQLQYFCQVCATPDTESLLNTIQRMLMKLGDDSNGGKNRSRKHRSDA